MKGKRVWGSAAVLGVALAVALAWRLPKLDARPMHGDEANQAVRTGQLMEGGGYQYDPTDHHGPILYFAALPFCRATAKHFSETIEWNFRLVPVTFSLVTLILMTLLAAKRKEDDLYLNPGGLLAALLLTACSPAMVYYNRFFIQESQLVTFLTGLFLCGVKGCSDGITPRARKVWVACGGIFAGLAIASKETVVLSFAAAAIALLVVFGPKRSLTALGWREWGIALLSLLAVVVVAFTSGFTHMRGLYDALFSTVSAYLHRATAVPEHQHPWYFYLQILFWFRYGRAALWTEAAILFPALVTMVAAWWPRSGLPSTWRMKVRFLTVYTLALTVIYSCIPYKTPWCGLSFLHGYLILAGISFGLLFHWGSAPTAPKRTALRIAVGGLTCLLLALILNRSCRQAYRAAFKLPADPRNPYVYAHTGTDAMNLVETVKQAAEKAQGLDTPIALAVPTPDTWPLPWYFRAYRNVGYWTSVKDIHPDFNPVVVIAAADQGDVADQRFGKGKTALFFGIRPGVLLNVFVPE
ncbi:MAG: TIGR03663 family protein [Kiritimatiellae bacterium]|nr:TIGR03663 family protein [Kiritimatiellia bacterium]